MIESSSDNETRWRVEETNNDLRYLLIKVDEALSADFLMRPDAQWFADYLNTLEARARHAEKQAAAPQRDVDLVVGSLSGALTQIGNLTAELETTRQALRDAEADAGALATVLDDAGHGSGEDWWVNRRAVLAAHNQRKGGQG